MAFDILCKTDKAELKDIILGRLNLMFGNITEDDLEETDIVCTRWSQMKNFGGAWFQFGPDATPADYNDLFQDQGNLIFSGEASCRRYFGFGHGALIAGWRDANLCLQRINDRIGANYPVNVEERCEELPVNNGGFYGGRFRPGKKRKRGAS